MADGGGFILDPKKQQRGFIDDPHNAIGRQHHHGNRGLLKGFLEYGFCFGELFFKLADPGDIGESPDHAQRPAFFIA